MKIIRKLSILVIIFILIIISLSHTSYIEKNKIIKNIMFGITASLITAVILEFLYNKREQKKLLDDFFWIGVIKYKESLEKIFELINLFYKYEYLFKHIPINSENWREYQATLKTSKVKLESLVNQCTLEISKNVEKYENHIYFINTLLSRMDARNFFYFKSKSFEKCYNLYHVMENLNYALCIANESIKNIDHTNNDDVIICKKIGICRYIADVFYVDYEILREDNEDCNSNKNDDEANVTDYNNKESNNSKAQEDFEKYFDEFTKHIYKF